ncbi:MAG: isocitrate lyase, partial [Actinomycetota bacterium]
MDTTTKARIRREAEELERRWANDPRWCGVERPYSGEDVVRLRGSVRVEHTIARAGAQRLWELLATRDYIAALGA